MQKQKNEHNITIGCVIITVMFQAGLKNPLVLKMLSNPLIN
nr:MAG TPA: hypothetical protein [Bacteriophage sp.]